MENDFKENSRSESSGPLPGLPEYDGYMSYDDMEPKDSKKENNEKDDDNDEHSHSLAKGVIIVCIIIIFLVGAILGGIIGVNVILNKINRNSAEIETVSPEDEDFEIDTDGKDTIDADSLELNAVDPIDDDGLLNILLVGQDKREGETGRTRSDAMILISVNLDTYQVSMISFLRDLYVLIPGYTSNRLNAAYVFGGYDLLKETILTNFGVHLDGYFEVDFSRFKTVIDTAGGVDVYLTEEEAEIVGAGVTQGVNHLDGQQALTYARIRKLDSDFGRTERQRTVLNALYEQVEGLGLSDILKLINSVLPMLTTNMTNSEIVSYATKLVPHVNDIKITTYSVPGDGTYVDETIRGMMVLVPDLQKIRSQLAYDYLPLYS